MADLISRWLEASLHASSAAREGRVLVRGVGLRANWVAAVPSATR